MAFIGLHVACVYTGGERDRDRVPLASKPVWSEAPAASTPSTREAPAVKNASGYPVFQVYASAECYLSIGPTPNIQASPRTLIPPGQLVEIMVDPGDRFSWMLA